jgi:hypothetical protein
MKKSTVAYSFGSSNALTQVGAGRLVEVEQLRVVEVRPELFVEREQPPVLRQLDREVRA